ncbi:MAG: hypothetical protein WCL53_09495 [Chloroflexota bacterium]
MNDTPASDAFRFTLSLPLCNVTGPARIEIADRIELVATPDGHALRTTVPVASAQAARQDLWIAMRALHVATSGVCWGTRIVTSIEGAPTAHESRSFDSRTHTQLPLPPLALSEADAPAISAAVAWCLEDRVRGALRTPLRRLHTSLRRGNDEARLIDLVTGLSALLLPHFDTDLPLRFAVRGFRLLGVSLDERQAIFLRLREAYRQRDHLREGGALDRESVPLDVLTDDLRRCIHACAQHVAETHEPIAEFVSALESDLLG